MSEDLEWWDLLPQVVRALRLIPCKATGYSPYVVVFKQTPNLPIPSALGPWDEQELEDLANDHLEEITQTFRLI